MYAEKIITRSAEMVSASAGIMKKMLATAAKSTTIMPMNRNLPRKLKSFLVTVATPASVKKISARAAGRHGDQRAPVGKAQGVLQDAREHQAHEEGEARRSATPRPLFLERSMPHMKAKATPMNTRKEIIGLPAKNEKRSCTLSHAPSTVRNVDSASSR